MDIPRAKGLADAHNLQGLREHFVTIMAYAEYPWFRVSYIMILYLYLRTD